MEIFSKIICFMSHKVDDKQINVGDHIYVWAGFNMYTHHGIAIGDNMVINVTSKTVRNAVSNRRINLPDCQVRGCAWGLPDNTSVYKVCLSCFKDGRSVRRYRYGVGTIEHMVKLPGTCTMAHSVPSEEVIKRADLIIHNGFKPYVLAKNNCEDFALYCKTNLRVPGSDDNPFNGTSSQANGVRATCLALVVGTCAAALTYSIAPYAFEYICRVGYRSIIDTSGQRNRLLRVTFTTFVSVAVVTFIRARHTFDVGVRSDAVPESPEDLKVRLNRKKQPMSPEARKNAIESGKWRVVPMSPEQREDAIKSGRWRVVPMSPEQREDALKSGKWRVVPMSPQQKDDAIKSGKAPNPPPPSDVDNNADADTDTDACA